MFGGKVGQFLHQIEKADMDEQPVTAFSYGMVQSALDEERYDLAIAMLTERIKAHPQDRMARLLLLLANMSIFGAAAFSRQIEDLRFLTTLSGNERHIVRRIFLVGFQHAEREGQTIQKIVYQRLIRRLMLGQPLDVSISEARQIEEANKHSVGGVIPDTFPVSQPFAFEAEPEFEPIPPPTVNHLERNALVGSGALIILVLSIFHLTTRHQTPLAWNHERPVVVATSTAGQMASGMQTSAPKVILPPTFTTEPVKGQIASQLGGLNLAYGRWSEADPGTSGSVALKLSVEPSGKVLRVNEVVSRLSEHRFIEVILTEAKLWKLPHDSGEAAEISIPLMFVPGQALPLELAEKPDSPGRAEVNDMRLATRTSDTRQGAEAKASQPNRLLANVDTAQPHTRGNLEPASDTQIAALASESGQSTTKAAAKQALAAAARVSERQTETARVAALKHEPRFAADAIEKVGLGTPVTVLRKERDWIKVKVQTSGNVGYLRKEYLIAFNTVH